MKLKTYINIQSVFFILVLLIALSITLFSTYRLAMKNRVPECKAIKTSFTMVGSRRFEKVLLISIVPVGWHKFNVLLNGNISDGDKKYAISRMMVADYTFRDGYYYIKILENIRHARDSTADAELNRQLPAKNRVYLMRIEKVSDNSYIFADNHAPLFVCSK
ncbi:TPA: hypothetical protein ACXJQO_004512 [Serratia marcescens]